MKYPEVDFDDSIYDLERMLDTYVIEKLVRCKWVEQGKNLIITGKTSSGKSYFANVFIVKHKCGKLQT